MWTCSQCGVVNPDESSVCECAAPRPAANSGARRPIPPLAWVHLAVVVILTLYVAFGPYGFVTRPPRRYHWEATEAQQRAQATFFYLKTLALVPLYLAFLGARRNWARLAVGIITLPVGLLLLIPRSLRQYTGAIPSDSDGRSGPTLLGLGRDTRD